MARYTFTCEHFDYNDFTGDEQNVASKHTTEFRADTLETMLENFEMFLRGAGFQFDGVIDIVPMEDGNDCEEDLRAIDDFVAERRSEKVMNHIVKDLMNNPFKTEDELDNMNKDFVAGASLNTASVFSEQGSFDFSENCQLCKLPINVMKLHQCFDSNCPCGAYRTQFAA